MPWFLEYENETLESKNDKTGEEKIYGIFNRGREEMKENMV